MQSKEAALCIRGRLLELTRPKVMGVLNLSEDSFYQSSISNTIDSAIGKVSVMIKEGMDILDLGPMSSRPGAKLVPTDHEAGLIQKFLVPIKNAFPELITSLDVFRLESIQIGIDLGVDIINDITGSHQCQDVFKSIHDAGLAYILMHSRGPFGNFHHADQKHYKHTSSDVIRELAIALDKAMQTGLQNIIIDPGFGFSKTIDQNFELLGQLECFCILERPLLVGLSRKSMIYTTCKSDQNQVLGGTLAAQTIALIKGANILRTHDVKEAVQCIDIVEKMKSVQSGI